MRGSGDAGAILLVDRATVPAPHDVPRALRCASTRSAPAQTCVEALVHPRRERLRARREGTVSTGTRFRRRLSEPARGLSDGSSTARRPPSPQVRKHPLRARTDVCGGSRSPKLYPRDGALRALSPKVNQSFVHIFSDAEPVLLHLLAWEASPDGRSVAGSRVESLRRPSNGFTTLISSRARNIDQVESHW